MADWMHPSPSSQSLFSSMLGDNIDSTTVSESIYEGESGFSFHGSQEHHASTNPNYRDGPQAHTAIDQTTTSWAMSEQQISSHGGLLERMAARAGFNAPRLNTETFKPADLSRDWEVRPPYLTIPSGLSPTTLLESPTFFSNSLYSKTFHVDGLSESADNSKDNFFGSMDASSFAFRPVSESGPSQFFGSSDRTSFSSIDVSVASENTFPPQTSEHPKANTLNQQTDSFRLSTIKDTGGGNMSEQRAIHSVSAGMEQSPPIDEQRDDEADPRAAGYFSAGVAPAEDGYNWRKYGQKQVKGSESLQCYYKCTHSHCLVKKKVERSQEGHITEIIYKGAHNHPKPSPAHRSALGSSGAFNDTQLDNGEHAFTGADGDPVWTNVQRGNVASEWRHDNPEVTSSAMLGAEYSNGATCLHVHNSSQFESGDAADRSSTFSNGEDDDERGTHGSVLVPYDGEGDESEPKKRKVEAYTADMSGATRAIKDPRVVVQTTSEVDILDDGYRWRKYGQKVVKGNPNPRSYYKCTSSGCSVRKHVERASHDLNSVITTYEGKHNHDVPAVRNSSHVNSGVSSNVPNAVQYRAEHSQHHNNMSSIHRSASFGSFGLPTGPHLIPPQDLGYGMNQRNMPNLALGGWGLNQGHQYIGQPHAMNEMELMVPKGEPKVEPMFDSGLSLPNASAVYQQALSRMPLGPHM